MLLAVVEDVVGGVGGVAVGCVSWVLRVMSGVGRDVVGVLKAGRVVRVVVIVPGVASTVPGVVPGVVAAVLWVVNAVPLGAIS